MPAPAPAPKTKGGKVFLVLTIIFGILVVALIGLSFWLWQEYSEQKNNVDAISTARVAEAIKKNSEEKEAEFTEREKEPRLQYTGPDDFGRLTFMYPKTWSLYVTPSDKVPYSANFHPKAVNSGSERYALRVSIVAKSYEDVVNSYKDRIAKKGLASKAVEVGQANNKVLGTRLDGPLTDRVTGSAVIFKIRDKTVTIQTDLQDLRDDFNKIIDSVSFIK